MSDEFENMFKEMDNMMKPGYQPVKRIPYVDDFIDWLKPRCINTWDFIQDKAIPSIKHVFTHLPYYALKVIQFYIIVQVALVTIAILGGIITNGNADFIATFYDKYLPIPFKWTTDHLFLKWGTIVVLFFWQNGWLKDWLEGWYKWDKLKCFIATCYVGFFVYSWFVPNSMELQGFIIGVPLTLLFLNSITSGSGNYTSSNTYSAPGDQIQNTNTTTTQSTNDSKITNKIESAVQRGNVVMVDSREYQGDKQGICGSGWSRSGQLLSQSENRIVIKDGNFIHTYDAKGNRINIQSSK